jgi:hypothetical protein
MPNNKTVPAADWSPAFLAALRNSANVRYSCEKAGIGRRTAYDRKEKDKDFANAWADALEDACDALEAVATTRARESSDVLMIFLLKAHRPEKFRENVNVKLNGPAFKVYGFDPATPSQEDANP